MSSLVDARGNPIRSVSAHKKAPAPQLGEKFGPQWMGDRDRSIFTMPGGGTVMFDLSRLRLADFRAMKDHYQINATLAVMTFMVHQMDWKIECDNPKIRDFVTENLRQVWTPFIRGISQAFWAGYSPNILQWDNETNGQRVVLTKVKDVIPEEATVHWKEVPSWAPPGRIPQKIKVFDGINVFGQNWPVPVENSFWYPLMMENGDMYGRKLLRPVFTSWYFSLLIHLFSNRYFERFGEPVPVGRASYDDEIDMNGTKVRGSDLMVQVLQNLRNRSVVVLPNDRSPTGNGSGTEYDYDIEYLESQMRGADFERYLMRLDEEMSIGLFTPLLILRTADVGSYNLGTTHWNMYLNMLNAIVGDIKSYADPYILDRLVDLNFGVKAPRARLKFRKMGDDKIEIVKSLLQSMVGKGTAAPDLEELGEIAGLTIKEVEVLVDETGGAPAKNPGEEKPGAKQRGTAKTGSGSGGSGGNKKVAKNSKKVISNTAGAFSALVSWGNPSSESFNSSFTDSLVDSMELDGFSNESISSVRGNLVRLMTAWMNDYPEDYFRKLGEWGSYNLIEGTLLRSFKQLSGLASDD